MVVLKKLSASTLMETLVASVLIVVIFMIASMILNNVFSNTIKYNTKTVDVYLDELMYLNKSGKLAMPYNELYKGWDITVTNVEKKEETIISFEAINQETNQTYSKSYIENPK